MADDPDAEERVTAHSYGALDGSEASSDCWLIRLPPAIADVWDSVPEGTDLGELVFRKGGGAPAAQGGSSASAAAATAANKPSITVHVNESLLDMAKQQRKHPHEQSGGTKDSKSSSSKPLPGVLPLHYGLQAMTKKVPVLHPFSRNPANGSVTVWGAVSRTANLQVTQDVQYRALLKDRLVTSNITGSRYVKPVEAAESIMSHNPAAAASVPASSVSSSSTTTASHHPGNNPHLSASAAEKKTFGNAISRIGKRILEVQEQSNSASPLVQQGNSKRSRQFSPDQPLRSVVFELFQLQERWAVKDLRVAAISGGATLANAKKAEAEIRDILREIGEYHRSGDYKNLWELKREFQTQQQLGASGASSTGGGGGSGPAAASSSGGAAG
jgi:TFIIF, beta subunit HTH domain/TFIIF, beta subunit N-terminus